jgi:acyl-CoA synthetase (AMP-forming)/AMP-acid ligase II
MTPMGFHTISGISVVMQALLSGGRISTVWPFRPEAVWEAIRRDGTNVLAVSPSMLLKMLDRRQVRDGESLLVVGVGAALVSPTIIARAEAEIRCPIVVGYGSTELGGGVFATDPWDQSAAAGNVGLALDGCQWKIVDESGRALGAHSVGELVQRSPGLMLGYQSPARGAFVASDGWYRTGDLAEADSAGRLRLVGRNDDLIRRGGFNLYPAEIERILRCHPEVADCAVVARPTSTGDEEVEAYVVPRMGSSLEADELESWSASYLASHKRPDRFEIRSTLPRTDAGELRRADLRGDT